jgi:ferric-dicitrate binding protein FerR (iron transport regulator)
METRDNDALGQAPDATVTPEELPARRRLARGWAVIAGAALLVAVLVLVIGWAI